MRPANHIKPFHVPFDLREDFQKETCDMLEAGMIERYEVAAVWNSKAVPVVGW